MIPRGRLAVLSLAGALPLFTATPALASPTLTSPALADPALADPALRPGDQGESVKKLQRRLHELRFLPGAVNGRYGRKTRIAVWAFQKTQRLVARNEVAQETWQALAHPKPGRPLVSGREPRRVEIGLRHQLLTVYRENRPVLITHISAGAGVRYCHAGRCRKAITPTGDFRVSVRAAGWTTGPLGSMYNSLYFAGGVAMHGSKRVPFRPASHGCVRLPMHASKRLFHLVTVGDPVYVRRE
ncbi:L,D-transpeptidase family protein [Streptosporangium sp. KLBMP 9127]|nr:L,D-transpeptidase family protein [Streptosporangium sp. KLBMP 9127]